MANYYHQIYYHGSRITISRTNSDVEIRINDICFMYINLNNIENPTLNRTDHYNPELISAAVSFFLATEARELTSMEADLERMRWKLESVEQKLNILYDKEDARQTDRIERQVALGRFADVVTPK